MAIYYLNAQPISRSKGQSIVACAAYRAGDKLYDERYDKLQDYTRKQGIAYSELLLPDNAPSWMADREKLWNTIERIEKRKDAQLAREVRFALPRELTPEQNVTLAREFIQHTLVEKGMIADWSLHIEKASDGGMQPHVHCLLTLREIKKDGFGHKVREWNKKENLLAWREKCADYTNRHLAINGHDLRIDHRSLADQGIDLIPQDKIGTVAARHRLDAFKAHQRASRENGERILADPNILLNNIICQQSTFNDHDIARFVSRHTADAEQFQTVYEKVKTSSELIALGTADDGRERFTTRKMFHLENEIQQLAEEVGERKHVKISSSFIQSALDHYHQKTGKQLTDEQLHAVKHILKSDSISCMVGRAGTGKSFSLGAAKAVWEAKGLRVHGIALSGVAADGLNKDAGMNSRTIESFCSAIEKGHLSLNKRDVVVMDEAGMTDSISMQRVIKAIHSSRAKLVLIGDPDQLQPVGPGAIFRAFLHRFGFSEIVTVYRQREEWQRQATRDFAGGDVEKGIESYRQNGCVHFERDEVAAMNRLVRDWETQSQRHSVDSLVVIAHTNEQVNKLNLMARESRVQRGLLAEGFEVKTNSGVIKVAKDDRILFLKNEDRLGVKNGRFATVTDVKFSESGRVLGLTAQLDGDDKKLIQFAPEKYKDFTYGYAATVHKLQGATYEKTFNYLGGSGWNRYLAYVASTRHKDSCQFYINRNDYPDFEALTTRLSRMSLKDSVLDFPRAFAERRGIDTNNLFKQLPKHLSERLSQLKEIIRDRYEKLVEPESYWRKKQEYIERQAKEEARYQYREDAKLVAAYADTNRIMGIHWQTFQTKMEQMGIKKLDYSAETYSLISGIQEHTLLNQTALLRDQLAAKLMKDPKRYGRAIKEAGISMRKLEAQALTQERRESIEVYQHADTTGRAVIRDRLAAGIASDFKKHYRLIRDNKIEPLQVREHAMAHVRREKLVGASATERDAYRMVARYQALTRQIGKEITHEKERYGENKDKPVPYAAGLHHIQKLKDMNLERGRIASIMMKDSGRFEGALDFYQIGKAQPLFNESMRPDSQQYAQKRWYRLQSQAALYDNRERIKVYQAAQLAKDHSQSRKIAYRVMQDIKAHHGAVIEFSSSSSELWRSIRQDANAYERDQIVDKLSPLEKERFVRVERYVEAKRAHAAAWKEIFETKKTTELSNEEFNQLSLFAKFHTNKRDVLAANILKELSSHRAGLLYHNIPVSELDKPAYAQICRERVSDYAAKNQDVLKRAEIARTIIENPKAHHAAMIEKGLSWRHVYRDANIAERKALFAGLSVDEKRFYRSAEKYHKLDRQIGKAWGKINASREIGKIIDIRKMQSLDYLKSYRDRLAVNLLEQKEVIELNTLFSDKPNKNLKIVNEVRLNWKKLEKQASLHQSRLNHVHEWQEAMIESNHILRSVAEKEFNTHKTALSNISRYADWLTIQAGILNKGKTIFKNIHQYHLVLHDAKLSPAIFQEKIHELGSLRELLDKLITHEKTRTSVSSIREYDIEKQQKIARALSIARETKPIDGTLAERYLREHRGIQGDLHHGTFRYHPHLKNWMTGETYPALVLLARDKNDSVVGVQAIFLDPTTANKAPLGKHVKLSRGIIGEGAVIHQGKADDRVAYAEGVETALSIAEAHPDWTVYATFSVNNFRKVPLKADSKSVLLCADNDGVGSGTEKNVCKSAKLLAEKGKHVWIALPDKPVAEKKWDFNDVLVKEGVASIRSALSKAILVEKGETIEALKSQAIDAIIKVSAPLNKSEPSQKSDALLKEMRAIADEYARQNPQRAEKLKQQVWGTHRDMQEKNEHKEISKVDPISQDKPITSEQRAYYEARFAQIMKESEIRSGETDNVNKLDKNDKFKKSDKHIQKLDKDIEIER